MGINPGVVHAPAHPSNVVAAGTERSPILLPASSPATANVLEWNLPLDLREKGLHTSSRSLRGHRAENRPPPGYARRTDFKDPDPRPQSRLGHRQPYSTDFP